MRRLLFMLVVLWASPLAAQDLALWVDVDGTTYLENLTSSPVTFDGYQIVSETGNLDVARWNSIQDKIPGNASYIVAALGAGPGLRRGGPD